VTDPNRAAVRDGSERNDLQALVVGVLYGSLMKADFLTIDLEIEDDEKGDIQPWFFVTGRESGAKLRVSVEVVDP
jgi:hypothetical protein